MAGCCSHGPGYATPLDAMKGPREELLYVICVIPDSEKSQRSDYLATVDANPASSTYGQVIHRLYMPGVGDELHHFGWNACSSCFGDVSASRSKLVIPGLRTNNIYIVDVGADQKSPSLYKTVTSQEILSKTGLTYPHSTHCLGSGEIMISMMGDPDGEAKGNFLLLNSDFSVKGKWAEQDAPFGYDFWYQPYHNVMLSSEWGAPKFFSKGFNPAEVPTGYGHSIHVWDWTTRKHKQTLSLGQDLAIPLELRFAHNPEAAYAFTGCALSSNLILIEKPQGSEEWKASVAVRQPWVKVEGWALPELPPLISDIVLSLDDRFIYFANWLRGDVVQYDITDPHNPRLTGRVWLGGSLRKDGPIKVLEGLPEGVTEQPEIPTIKGKRLHGGPQMLQLSLDGKRLFVTNSLFTSWDQQFYPDVVAGGGYLVQLDVDTDKGGLSINHDFFVDFGAEPGGPVLAHEVRYPGGDCSSDIWLSTKEHTPAAHEHHSVAHSTAPHHDHASPAHSHAH